VLAGKKTQEFGVPHEVYGLGMQFTDDRSVVVGGPMGGLFLLNLENEAVVGYIPYNATADPTCVSGGVVWTWPRQATSGKPQFVTGGPIVAAAGAGPRLEDHAAVYPGGHVAVVVDGSLADKKTIREDLQETAKAKGFVLDPLAGRRFVLSLAEREPSHERTIRDGRQLAWRSMEFHFKLTDESGKTVWEQRRTIPWSAIVVSDRTTDTAEVTQQALRNKIRELAGHLRIPRYIFPKIDDLNIPPISVPNATGSTP
jgi:hypothetical protein